MSQIKHALAEILHVVEGLIQAGAFPRLWKLEEVAKK